MDSEKNFGQMENQEENKENYGENLELLEKAKDKFAEMGLFRKDFVDGLNYFFINKMKKEEGEVKSYQLAPDGKTVEIDEEKFTNAKDIFIYSKDLSEKLLEKFDKLFQEQDEINNSTFLWMEGIDFKAFYSFDAIAAHETAHTKSHASIMENNSLLFDSFDREKFISIVEETVKDNEYSQKVENINLSKFDFSVYNWSELYALLYHREFLRKDNSDNSKMIEEWDNHIIEVSKDLSGAMEKFNEEKGTDIDPEIIYKDGHAFSFLLARVFEEKYRDFDERIKVLEKCKKE